MVRLMHATVCGEKLSVIASFDGMDFSGGRGIGPPCRASQNRRGLRRFESAAAQLAPAKGGYSGCE